MADDFNSDGSSLDPSDIIERYVDSDASDLSQPPPAIHDLSAELARLLHHHHSTSSSSEESDDARSPKRSPGVRRRRRRGLQGDRPFDVTSTTESGANNQSNPGAAPTEDHYRISRGGAAPFSKPPTVSSLLTIRSGPIERNNRILLTTQNPASSSKGPTQLVLPMSMQRLQSTESIRSLVAGSPLGSARSSMSQLSDVCPAKPLAEELEEADEQEKLRNKAALFDNSDSSSVFYSGDEESGGEGSLLSEEIDFELHDEEDPPPQIMSEPSWTHTTSQSEQRTLEQSAVGRMEIQKEPQDPPKESEGIGIMTTQKGTSLTNPPTTTLQSSSFPIVQRASTFEEPSSDPVDNEAQHSQPRTLTPPLGTTVETKQQAREVSSGLENLQQSQICLRSGPSVHEEPKKPDPRTQRRSSGEGDSKRPVRVKRFSRQKKPVTPPPSRKARKSSAESQQGGTLLQHSPVKRKETRTLTDQLIPEKMEPRWEYLLYTDSEDSPSSSESEEMEVSATPSPFTASEREHEMSEALPKVNIPILERHKPTNAFPSVASSEPEPTLGLKPAIVQQPSNSPLLKVMSSPSLPLKGILKKRSGFESMRSTSTDLTTVTPMGSKASSCSSLDTAVEISSTLVRGTPSVVSEQRKVPSQMDRARSSTSSSGESCYLERTLTNEQTHAAAIYRQPMVPCIHQPAHTNTKATLVTKSSDEGSLHRGGVIDEEAFKESLKTQMQKMPLTSSPLPACRNLANHPLSKKQASPSATNSSNTNRKTTQLKISDGGALDSAANAVQTPATDDLKEKVRALETRQVRMEKIFAVERKALWDIIFQQNQLIASMQKKRRCDQTKITKGERHIRLLEGKLAQLEANMVRLGRTANETQGVRRLSEADLESSETRERFCSLVSRKKLAKLTKFFGDTPPVLQQFLERLGYEEHAEKLKKAGIGLPELPHITDEQLKQLGIPLGHRARMLHEARKLSSET